MAPEEIRELLLGTWIGVALIADALIRAGLVSREDITEPLEAAEAIFTDQRRVALRALGGLIRDGLGGETPPPHPPVDPNAVMALIRRYADKRPR